MNRVVKILMFCLMWIVIAGTIILLAMQSRSRRENQTVESIQINIIDSVGEGNLVTTQMVHSMLNNKKIKVLELPVKQAPLSLIEQTIASNGFVESVKSYIDYNGVLSIDVEQRSPLARIRLNNYNCYITDNGFVFSSPPRTAIDVPIITGSYRPLFDTQYRGSIDEFMEAEVAKIDLEIARVEREKYPIYLREEANNADKREVRRRYINRSIFESKDEFARRVSTVREENRKLRELHAYRQRVIEADLKALERQQERYREAQKKVRKKCEDIHNLITFVEMIERDPLWRSEIVQINLTQSYDGNMRVSVAMRSGNFAVTFGELSHDEAGASIETELKAKFDRLRRFYNEALPRVGWDRYREINIEFENQVICKR